MLKKIPYWLLRVTAVFLVSGLIYLAWELSHTDDSPISASSGSVNAARVGTPAVDFTIPANLVGNQNTFQFSSIKGTPIIFHFWATWCGPCVQELPELIELAKKVRPKGYALVAVAVDDDWKTVESFFSRYPKLAGLREVAVLILDPRGTVANLYDVSRFPETLLINHDFVIDNKLIGPQPWLTREMGRYLDRLKPEGSL